MADERTRSTRRSRLGALTWATILLLALFAGVDATAHFTRYQYGETFSAFVWQMQRKLPFMRVIVGVLIVILFTHLEFRLP